MLFLYILSAEGDQPEMMSCDTSEDTGAGLKIVGVTSAVGVEDSAETSELLAKVTEAKSVEDKAETDEKVFI